MRPLAIAVVTALAIAFAGHANARAPQLDPPIVLSMSDVARLGIRTAPLRPARYTQHVHGYAVVADLGSLAQTDAAVATAEAAARQSGNDVKRARALFAQGGAISQQALDAAEHQAASDQAALLLAQRQEVVQFGANVPWRGAHADRSILTDLTSGHAILVKVTFPLDALGGAQPHEIAVTRLNAHDDQSGWTAKTIWSAPADPTIPGNTYFAVVTGSDLQAGDHALAYAPVGETAGGFDVPANAILFSNGKTWCYLQLAPNVFQRVPIELNRPLTDGYFIDGHSLAAKPVVVRGGGLLLSREFGAALLRE